MGYFVLQWLLALLAGEASSVKHSTLLHNLLRRVHLEQCNMQHHLDKLGELQFD